MTIRRSLTRGQKLRIFNRAAGICHVCKRKIHAGEQWEAEHVVPLWAGGEDTPENMAPAHLDPCHRSKTSDEATDRAKEIRIGANHVGIPKPGKKMRGHRDDSITITINRGVQPRIKGKGAKHRLTMAAYPNWRGE